MSSRLCRTLLLAAIAWPLSLGGQSSVRENAAEARAPRTQIEFPLRLKHKVIAGKTNVGTPVEGELVLPTLVKGYVIPKGAVFVGTVEESVAHEKEIASRLRIRLTEAKWRDYSVPLQLYATGFMYPPFRTVRYRRGHITSLDYAHMEVEQSRLPGTPDFNPRQLLNSDVRNERSADGVIVIVSEKSTIRLSGGVVYCFEGSPSN